MIVALALAAAVAVPYPTPAIDPASYAPRIARPASPTFTWQNGQDNYVGGIVGGAGLRVRSCAGGLPLVGKTDPQPPGKFTGFNRNFAFVPDLSEADKNTVVRMLLAVIERDHEAMKPLCVQKRP